MQAVILSGGFGTRMRPLTHTTPKPLLPILNKPLIQHVIDGLPEVVDQVIMAANYKIDMLREYFDEIEVSGREIHVVDEPEPLGTGGAVKNVEEYLDDTFFVINADIISSIDMKDYLDFYNSKDCVAAISAWEVKNPEEFGVFELDENDRIIRFQEKPKAWEAFSNTINAGHYILEPEVLDLIPPGQKISMEREIFPQLIDKGFFGYNFDGYWVDCGRPRSFLKANKELLRKHQPETKNLIGERSVVDGELGEYVTVGVDCTIEKSNISNSIIFDGVEIDEGCSIYGSIIGYDVIVEKNVELEGCIVSDEMILNEGEKHVREKIMEE